MNLTASSSRTIIYPASRLPDYLKHYNRLFLLCLLAINFLFIGLHSLKSLGYLSDPNLSVTKRFGYGESFMYLNELFITGCFLWLAFKFKHTLFYCWAAVFAYILLDDSMDIHETLGYKIGAFLDQHTGLPAGAGAEAGEMLTFGFFGLVLFIPLFISYFKTTNRHIKIATQDLLVLFAGVLLFGIGVDVLNDFFETGTFLNGFLGMLEDAGEMVMISLIAWYTWTFITHDDFIHPQGTQKQPHINAVLKEKQAPQPTEPQ